MPYDAQVSELPIQTVLNLRGGEDARAAFSDLLGLDLPQQATMVASKGDIRALTISPDEWLLSAPAADEARLEEGLRKAVEEMFAAVTTVSDMHIVYPGVRTASARCPCPGYVGGPSFPSVWAWPLRPDCICQDNRRGHPPNRRRSDL